MWIQLLVFTAFSVVSTLEKRWDYHVFSGRHFDDYITQTTVPSPQVMIPAVLILYTPGCESTMNSEKLGEYRMLPNQQMVMAKYDYETFPNYIWYEMDAIDDLKGRYQPEKCPDYLYFKKGMNHDEEPERYDRSFGKTVFHWIWDKFAVKFNVINERSGRILVEFRGLGPKISSYTIEGNSDMVLEAYVSYFILISDAERQIFLYGAEIDETFNEKIIVLENKSEMPEKADVWFQAKKEKQQSLHADIKTWRWGIADIYLHDFKQPVLLPKFTELGYKKGKIPADLYADLLKFYREHIDERKDEMHKVEPAINDSEVKCSMVYLSDEMIERTATAMKPLMEEWSNVTLVQTRLYGIREYYRGNKLRNHVDRVTTHVVSVILQIDQDLEGQPEWELEVIGFDGKRKNVTLQPGEMLYYESATLIHGRPFPYQGRIFANAFLHYKPVHGWGWDLTNDLIHYTYDNQKVENVVIFETPNMYKKKISLEKFVERPGHKHDEL